MTHINFFATGPLPRAPYSGLTALERASRWFQDAVKAWKTNREYQANLGSVSRLDEAVLRDLGLTPADFARLHSGPFAISRENNGAVSLIPLHCDLRSGLTAIGMIAE